MGISKVDPPRPNPRLVPSLVGDDAEAVARESTAHADAIARLEAQFGATATSVAGLTGRYLGRRILTGTGTYTPTTSTTYVIVDAIAGGGAGGGATSTAGGVGAGAGGSSGVKLKIALGTPGVTLTGGAYSCGAGGTPVSGATGGNGGDTTFVVNGTTYTAKGGAGGAVGASTTGNGFAMAGAPAAGTSSGGLTTFGYGEDGMVLGGAIWISGCGGTTELGAGGLEVGGGVNGNAGALYGAGGSGAAAQSTVNRAGGAGAAGGIIIDEYT